MAEGTRLRPLRSVGTLVFALCSLAASILLVSFPPTAVQASGAPYPSFGEASIDGNSSEWSNTDFFAPMFRAFDPAKQWQSTFHLRYSCASRRLYAAVLVQPGYVVDPTPNDAWIKISGVRGNLVDGNSPDFRWFVVQGRYVGWEGSAPLAPGQYTIVGHVEVLDASSARQTSGTTADTARTPGTLIVDCSASSATVVTTPIATPSPTVTASPTSIATPSATVTATPTPIAPPSPTVTATPTRTVTPTPSARVGQLGRVACGVAGVDGIAQEWRAFDFFARLVTESNGAWGGDLYLRYNEPENRLYLLVLSQRGYLLSPDFSRLRLSVNGLPTAILSEDPSRFRWIDSVEARVGFESSVDVVPGSYELSVRAEVLDSSNRRMSVGTSNGDGSPYIPLLARCSGGSLPLPIATPMLTAVPTVTSTSTPSLPTVIRSATATSTPGASPTLTPSPRVPLSVLPPATPPAPSSVTPSGAEGIFFLKQCSSAGATAFISDSDGRQYSFSLPMNAVEQCAAIWALPSGPVMSRISVALMTNDDNVVQYSATIARVPQWGVAKDSVSRCPIVGGQLTLERFADSRWVTTYPADMTPSLNPQFTGLDGSYGWGVPVGTYRVRFEHSQYQSSITEPVQMTASGIVQLPVDIEATPVAGTRSACVAVPLPAKTGNAGLQAMVNSRHAPLRAVSSGAAKAIFAGGLLSLVTAAALLEAGVSRNRMR